MLQVTDTGANITLTGKSAVNGDGMFWFAFALLIGAVAVAMAMSLLPTRFAIGALAALILGSFVFNWIRANQKKPAQPVINTGILKVQTGMFVHYQTGKHQEFFIEAQDDIKVKDCELFIYDANGKLKYHVLGFETEKEAKIMRAVLEGQSFAKRNANIKMQSS